MLLHRPLPLSVVIVKLPIVILVFFVAVACFFSEYVVDTVAIVSCLSATEDRPRSVTRNGQ